MSEASGLPASPSFTMRGSRNRGTAEPRNRGQPIRQDVGLRSDGTQAMGPPSPAHAGWDTGGKEVGTNRVLAWHLVAARVTSRDSSVQAIRGGNRDRGEVERPLTEPKVRGSNPLGRAPQKWLWQAKFGCRTVIPSRPLGGNGWEQGGCHEVTRRPR